MSGDYTPSDLYSDFRAALAIPNKQLWLRDDEFIGWSLYEEFDGWVLLSDAALRRLQDAGLIDDEIARSCQRIRDLWVGLESTWRERTIDEHRKSKEWGDLFEMCENVSARLAEREA